MPNLLLRTVSLFSRSYPWDTGFYIFGFGYKLVSHHQLFEVLFDSFAEWMIGRFIKFNHFFRLSPDFGPLSPDSNLYG
ncbi:MAG: hypothetical protein KTR29_14965 [Rhodothermaceae bacterium]|nr:hypothetical protein [Rhodothermaceae bacterium]